MLRVGLTGGLASGKSFVGKALAEQGCYLIKADEIGHQVLSPGGEAFALVVREFGPAFLAPDGSLDRKRLATEVFNRPERLAALNRLVHPPVIRRQDRMMEEIGARDPGAIVIVEAAVMIEAGTFRRLDKLIEGQPKILRMALLRVIKRQQEERQHCQQSVVDQSRQPLEEAVNCPKLQ